MGVTPSPSVHRVALLLDALAVHPGATLADLVRATQINKATAHSLLLGLTETNFVRRTEDPITYTLGPALIALGQRARAGVDVADVAAGILQGLSQSSGCTAIVGAVHGSMITVVAAEAQPHPFGVGVQPGTRISFAAPIGAIYAAFATPRTLTRWLERANSPLSARRKKVLLGELDLIRKRGWSATIRSQTRGDSDVHEISPSELRASQIDILGISAPVLGTDDCIEFSVALVDLSAATGGREVPALAKQVVDAAAQLREAIEPNWTEGSR
jgi:DNA-binding IclR family transcriptional regulator